MIVMDSKTQFIVDIIIKVTQKRFLLAMLLKF